MRRSLTAAAVALALALTACDSDRRAISRDDLPDVPSEATVAVELGADGFSQPELEVTTADLVEFHNVDDANHGVRTEDYEIDTGPLFPDESTFVIFDTPGRYTVFDTEDADTTMEVVATAPTGPSVP